MTDQGQLSKKRSRYTSKIRICPCRRAEGVGLLQAAQQSVCLPHTPASLGVSLKHPAVCSLAFMEAGEK